MGEGICRRVFASALAFATQRKVFGRLLVQQPMMQDCLLSMMAESEAGSALLFRVPAVLKTEDMAKDHPDANEIQRILTPMAKFRCCRRGVDMASMAIEVFGGNGYIEDWSMERQFRDAQNHPMWEGTEIVLSIDVIRAAPQSLSALHRLLSSIATSLSSSSQKAQNLLGSLLNSEIALLPQAESFSPSAVLASASRFANMLADLVQFALLCEQALFAHAPPRHQHRSFVVAALFALLHLLPRSSCWSHATVGGYPITRRLFDALVSGAIVSAADADATVAELLTPRAKL